ncbi:MAG TPA: hypothetical protein VGR74_12515, partial [Actinomycetota bacterium]|nr:hypothetical protein [Actinomycetota bacterium]
LLRLAQGQVDAAAAAIRRVMDEASDRVARSKLLAAHVEIMLAAGDVHAAHAAADELAQVAGDLGGPPTPRVPCSSARATRAPPSRHCARRGRPGRSWRCRTRRRASGS